MHLMVTDLLPFYLWRLLIIQHTCFEFQGILTRLICLNTCITETLLVFNFVVYYRIGVIHLHSGHMFLSLMIWSTVCPDMKFS